jgi:hypothetical protein
MFNKKMQEAGDFISFHFIISQYSLFILHIKKDRLLLFVMLFFSKLVKFKYCVFFTMKDNFEIYLLSQNYFF